MDGREEGTSDPSRQEQEQERDISETEYRASHGTAPEIPGLPPMEPVAADPATHDLSYLAGPPFASADQIPQTRRYFEGLAENARVLGISKSDLLRSDARSPFHSIDSATNSHAHLPRSLQPTVIQHRYAHHPFFDCIPIPQFRDRAILAVTTTPPLINRFEVCYDLFAGGLTFTGDPTIEQSWSFSDSFQDKWGALITANVHDLQRRADSSTTASSA